MHSIYIIFRTHIYAQNKTGKITRRLQFAKDIYIQSIFLLLYYTERQ